MGPKWTPVGDKIGSPKPHPGSPGLISVILFVEVSICEWTPMTLQPPIFLWDTHSKTRAFSLYATFDVLELLSDFSFDSHRIFTVSTTSVKTNSCTAARGIMILGPVSLLDCVIFVLFLLPNLLVQVGPVQILSLIKVIPFLGTFTSSPSCQDRDMCWDMLTAQVVLS
jgi:hypothetical protein